MSEFALVYRKGATDLSPEEKQQRTRDNLAWFKGLLERGVIKDIGVPLGPAGSVVGRQGVIHDGPYAEAKDVIVGLTVINAKDLAEAIEIAKTCPMVLTGDLVEVRSVEPC
jgi:hypothetical protein